ncbi:UvrD-helicase domain-containing protein [Thalassospira lucentensis]|uniref:UvrD-helicase domain-containing protein n=1 Tax=Thalassospira lucentensis TaxID=168935 RepID=UPI003D2DFD45|tara:strand:- start:7137 stop:9140 length:2004 start_codon:yes stop_codon:yes gene_type:complete
MKDLIPFVFPDITDEDIAWASRIMELPADAFDQARQEVLKDRASIDIAACPGSGKTTILVAKLAILARKWRDTRRGICVLSHTNVARTEIEQRLGSTAEGQALLSYPHFIGTIHGFVDRFLGVPWIKACGHPVSMIDTGAALERRWRRLPDWTRTALENKRNGPALLKVTATDFSVGDVNWGRGRTLGRQTPTYRDMMAACRKTAEDGYFCYEDPFLWGRELTEIAPETIEALRSRFSVLFIDEAQDNSELQSSILHRVFADGESEVVCQRFGDANQAIFNSVDSKDVPTTWVFPSDDENIKRDIPDSHRFGPSIADFAAPFAIVPQGLTGKGPDQRKAGADIGEMHTVFFFEEGAQAHVLPAFTDYLHEIFAPDVLSNGSFVAVGGKHKEPKDDNNKPNSVCDYWSAYSPEQTRADPKPDTFIGYLQAGHSKFDKHGSGNLHNMVESIAEGVLEAVRRAGGKIVRKLRKDRYIREVLVEKPEVLVGYSEFMCRFAVNQEDLTQQKWENEWQRKVSDVAEAMFDGEEAYQAPQAFLNWPDVGADAPARAQAGTIYQKDEQLPKIRLGSIHSVKGETHTGVLVLETFWHGYYHGKLKSWLLREKQGGNREGVQNLSRLKLHYVAMTRPTHLLCLAVPSGTFTPDEINTLLEAGWRIARIAAGGQVRWG